MKTLVMVCLSAASVAQASLDWEREECHPAVHPTQASANSVFRFVNTGEKPVAITDVRITCGCLSPKLEKSVFAPGEAGKLLVGFDLRNRTGKQRKAVIVKTDDGIETRLYVECDIPWAYVPEPKKVLWKKGDNAPAKTVRLRNPGTLPIKLLSATSSCEGLPVELKSIREGFEYVVVITRETSAANARSVVRITTEPPPGLTKSKTIKLYVHAQ